jgi:hypothetical protein
VLDVAPEKILMRMGTAEILPFVVFLFFFIIPYSAPKFLEG